MDIFLFCLVFQTWLHLLSRIKVYSVFIQCTKENANQKLQIGSHFIFLGPYSLGHSLWGTSCAPPPPTRAPETCEQHSLAEEPKSLGYSPWKHTLCPIPTHQSLGDLDASSPHPHSSLMAFVTTRALAHPNLERWVSGSSTEEPYSLYHCPWRSSCTPPYLAKPQRPGSNLMTPPNTPQWHLRPLEHWPHQYLERVWLWMHLEGWVTESPAGRPYFVGCSSLDISRILPVTMEN